MNFEQFLIEKEFDEFNSAIDSILENNVNENMFTDKIKRGLDFIKELALLVKSEFKDLLVLFKNKVIFAFFTKILWSIKSLIDLVKKGHKLWVEFHNVISRYIANSKIMKYTDENLKKIDEFLSNHPIMKRGGSLIIVGLLIYIWARLISFTGDLDFDFNQSAIFDAIMGNYTLSDLFGGVNGSKLLVFILTNLITGVTFPYPGNTWVLFAGSLLYTVCKNKYPSLSYKILSNIKKVKL